METHRRLREQALREADDASPAQQSTRLMGNATLAVEDARAVWLWPWLESLWLDVRHGLRALRRQPTFAITGLLTIAVGSGALTAAFAVAHTVLFKRQRAMRFVRNRVLATVTAGIVSACSQSAPRVLPEPAWPTASALERPEAIELAVPPTDWPDPPADGSGLSPEGTSTADRIHDELPDVRALLILRGGTLAYERYFGNASRTTSFNVKSVTKSVVSALTGIALADGVLPGLDQRVSKWLPEIEAGNVDRRLDTLTLRHLLTMTAGFRWGENGPATAAWMRSADYVRFTLESPLDAAPGERFNYSTAVAHLVSVILSRAAGMSTRQFAEERLFAPIGIKPGAWAQDPQGYHEGGSELHLTACDMARFGLLYLNQGRWNGRSVVPRQWVLESTRPQGRIDYGYLWTYLPKEWGGPAVSALGYGGQLIAIVPDADAVIVVASTPVNPGNDVMRYLRESLLPAVRGKR